jgi:hypothetical protein
MSDSRQVSSNTGAFTLGSGTVMVIAFFLPLVRACGQDASAYDIAQEHPDFWIYLAGGLGIAVMGFILVNARHLRQLCVAQGVLGGVALIHLAMRAMEFLQKGELEVLWGAYLLAAATLFSAVFPWLALSGSSGGTDAYDLDDMDHPNDALEDGGWDEPASLRERGMPRPALVIGLGVLAWVGAGTAWPYIFEFLREITGDAAAFGAFSLARLVPAALFAALICILPRVPEGRAAIKGGLLAALLMFGAFAAFTAMEAHGTLLDITRRIIGYSALGAGAGLLLGQRRRALGGALGGATYTLLTALYVAFLGQEVMEAVIPVLGHTGFQVLDSAVFGTLCWSLVTWGEHRGAQREQLAHAPEEAALAA